MGTPQGPYPPPSPPPGGPGAPAPAYPPYPQAYPSYYPPAPVPFQTPYSPAGSPGTRDAESRAMRMIRIAAIIGLVGAIITFAAVFVIPAATGTSLFGGLSNLPTNGTANSTSNATSVLHSLAKIVDLLIVVGIIGIVFEFVSAYYYREGFKLLRPFDNRFSGPTGLTVVLLVGLVIEVPGLALLLGSVQTLANCASTATNSTAQSCTSGLVGTLIGGLALYALAGILLLIGLIGGLVLGSWRLGTRYDSTLFKVGAILLIFFAPLGNLLILIDAYSVGQRLGSMPGGPPGGGPSAYQPPGYNPAAPTYIPPGSTPPPGYNPPR